MKSPAIPVNLLYVEKKEKVLLLNKHCQAEDAHHRQSAKEIAKGDRNLTLLHS